MICIVCCGTVPILKFADTVYIYIHGNNEQAFIFKKENMKCDVTTERLFGVSHIYHIYWILRSYGMIQKVNDESVFYVQI
jgi:hypothetical protein